MDKVPTTPRIHRPKHNIVYTNPLFAKRIVDYFRPQYKTYPAYNSPDYFFDPCKGSGAFYDAFGECHKDYCEIQEGKDWLEYDKEHRYRIDWIITNPPWSAKEYRPIFRKCLEYSDNVVFLIRLHNGLGTNARHNDYLEFGHKIKEIIVVPWKDVGFPSEGFTLAVIHWQKGYDGDCKWTYWK